MRWEIKISLIEVCVYLTMLGYWYNLPIISTSIFGGYNEFRLYDFTFLILPFLLLKHRSLKMVLFSMKSDPSLKYIYWFAVWASIMTLPTLVFVALRGDLVYAGMTIMFLYHLWGFILLAAIILTYYDAVTVIPLIKWFLVLSTLHLLLYYLQISGIIGHLWAQQYLEAYGENAFSGTLGPNRITPGMMTFLGLTVSLFILISRVDSKFLRIIAWINIFFALPAVFMIGSRTTFITVVLFGVFYLLFFRIRLIPVAVILIPFFVLFYNHGLNQKQKDRITNNIEWNEKKLLRGGQLDDITIIEGYENLGSNRAQILEKYLPFLLNHVYILPVGFGFNNRIIANSTGAASAHNIYLSLLNEVGFIGLFLYVSWLISYIITERKREKLIPHYRGKGLITSLVIAMIISLMAGEHLYVYRPCFAILGTFLFVITVMGLFEQPLRTDEDFEL
ncbi:MAG TPA: O-antigen ligase family protein [Spirochaetota bacterium]|nr:O-antigen ligase family protein [Spirochaetota bacterium]